MGSPICLMVFFLLAAESVHGQDRFFISAPNVFHVGVKERVYVQLGKALLKTRVTLYLEHEITREVISQKNSTVCTEEVPIQTVELEVDRDKLPTFVDIPYLMLVAEMEGNKNREMVRVLVSQHRGYIFIQTDQPNAAGNRIMKTLKRATDGIFADAPFNIPDVSEMGVWRIVAHYQGDEKNAVTREFQVKKFVLPSFEVTVKPEQSYFLLNTEQFTFTISAKYSYGESIQGAFHCRFGVKEKTQGPDGEKEKTVFIRGLELTGSIQAGEGSAVLQTSKLVEQLQSNLNTTLSDMDQSEAKLYMAVSVTDIISGELQEAEVSLPVVSKRYTVDLSRTRSHYIPGVPFSVVVVVRLPNGSPAVGEPVKMHLKNLQDGAQTIKTNEEGAVWHDFNLPNYNHDITVEVTVDGQKETKDVKCASSPGNTYLSVSVSQEILTAGQSLSVTFKVLNGSPEDGFIYYMVFSRGVLRKQGSVKSGDLTKILLPITPDMTPSFRLIGYNYDQNGDIIADSVWVDVKDICEGTVEVKSKYEYQPGKTAKLEINLNGQKANVALLAVFSSMQSYDLGCSYGGGSDTASVFNDAGLSFISNSGVKSKMRIGLNCESGFRRQRRSLDLQQQMMSIKSSYSDAKLQECCSHGFTLIPMLKTCQQRAERVARANKDPVCVKAFLDCCIEGEKLREKKRRDDAQTGHGRTASATDVEDFFDTTNQQIRRSFPPSFVFAVVNIKDKGIHIVALPDSITTWEIQAVSLSASHGICVAEPHEFRVFKEVFVSLRLPYSVKRFEQMSIVPIVYNYGNQNAQIALHMERNDKLCSPGSSSIKTYVNITVDAHSSKAVTFSAVPMETGPIPIIIRLYDIENEDGTDAIEKILNVRTEGIEKRVEETHLVDLSGNIGKSSKSFMIDGKLPDNTVPGSNTNIFVKMEGEVFGQSTARTLLSPDGVKGLLKAPHGCAEQTMKRMAPTALALRYLDLSQRWYELTPGIRDTALQFTEQELQNSGRGEKGRQAQGVSEEEISHSVRYLLVKQKEDGSFSDPNPKDSIVKATNYLLSRVEGLQRPYAVAITAYCLSVCLSDRTKAEPAWEKLKGLATEGKDHCHGWYANAGMVNEENKRYVPTTEAITVETTAYALLTAVTKAYHLLDTSDDCNLLSITVKVEGKVEYTAQIVEDYNDYGDGDGEKREEEDVPRSAIEWFDARSRRRRDTQESRNSQNAVEYEVCVSLSRNLTGMAIADITLLSGFEADTDDLDKLKNPDEQYISHYEVSHGKVLLYFNELEERECVTFRAVQTVLVGLLQPAPATFYDYYEPGFIVQVISISVKSNFELYTTNVTQVLRATGDVKLEESTVRVFAKRLQCKGQLETGKKYLIMGKDGATTDSNGQMQYLLESNTWIEQVPDGKKCKGSNNRPTCKKFDDFVSEYMLNGCTQ
ncbi:unnamed protein product [Coregonus sp. 'balchen']|nr:unnamed protein product [Coregonus sp. 'balchen']